ncbi:MAG: hypothetical protein L0Y42_14340 [Phycisphaerales bacterium]|nr:hypothetical protein [Phycisphaerales bacterium]
MHDSPLLTPARVIEEECAHKDGLVFLPFSSPRFRIKLDSPWREERNRNERNNRARYDEGRVPQQQPENRHDAKDEKQSTH